MAEYACGIEDYDEGTFYAALKRAYRSLDYKYTQSTRPYLKALVSSGNNGDLTKKIYTSRFNAASAKQIANGTLDNASRYRLYLVGFPKTFRDRLFRKLPVEQRSFEHLKYTNLRKLSLDLLN